MKWQRAKVLQDVPYVPTSMWVRVGPPATRLYVENGKVVEATAFETHYVAEDGRPYHVRQSEVELLPEFLPEVLPEKWRVRA